MDTLRRGRATPRELLPALTSVPQRGTIHPRPCTEGKFLTVHGQRFWIRGVTYGTFLPNSRGELLPEPDVVRRDLRRMAAAGVNTVRTYTTPPVWFMDEALESGLMVVAGIFWEGRQCLFRDETRLRDIELSVQREFQDIAAHPALLMVCIGNEIPPQVARWDGKEAVEKTLRCLRDRVKEIDPGALVTYANYPPTEFLDLSYLDVVGFNVYLEREPEFRDYLARLQMLAGDRPLFLSELGLDSRRGGIHRQAEILDWQLRAVWGKGLTGATVYAWTDEWAVAGKEIDDWDFGLVTRSRHAKPALEAVRRSFSGTHYDLRTDWPPVSVVCCAYNAESTLGETLESLTRLNYPDYEVIVVDDGSRDATAQIAERYPCRLLSVPNGGLSRARNLGIDAARGEVVAFIDSDAAADPDWLFFLVTHLRDQNAAGVGGPNLCPPADPETAQQVARSPGNPVHVLLDNETAEHVPGCNMAFRKDVLQRIGGFNPVYRTAGDDVDVCWKVLELGETLAFSPTAIVWHHRRNTRWAYLKQQFGYGYAESLLEARYPECYGLFGGATWQGNVYEGPQPAAPAWLANRRQRVYHGPLANGLFQSVYTPRAPWWAAAVVTPEFYGVSAALLATAALSAASGWPIWPLPAAVGIAGLLLTISSCLEAGRQMCARDELHGWPRWKRVLGVARLHLEQPWARWKGRVQGALRSRVEQPWPARPEGRLWAGWDRRDEWLNSLSGLLRRAGLQVDEAGPWARHDLEIRSYPGYVARLESVVENQTEIRFRARVSAPLRLRLLEAGILALMAGTVLAPPALPLLFPLGGAFWALHKERRRLAATVALVGEKAGRLLGMVPLGAEPAAETLAEACATIPQEAAA